LSNVKLEIERERERERNRERQREYVTFRNWRVCQKKYRC
jgi:hypothetical protein